MDIERLRGVIRRASEMQGDPTAVKLLAELADILLAEYDTLTTAEAAARLKVTPYAVRKLVLRGRLVARHEGRELRITRESVEAFAVNRRPRKTKQ